MLCDSFLSCFLCSRSRRKTLRYHVIPALSLLIFSTLLLFSHRSSLQCETNRQNREFVVPPLEKTWYGKVVAPAPHNDCAVSIISLPPPILIKGESIANNFICADEIQRDKSLDYLEGIWEQHRLAHYVKVSLSMRQSTAPEIHIPTIGLVDDVIWHDCWDYVNNGGKAIIFPRWKEQREEAIRETLACNSRQSKTWRSSAVALLEDHPYYNARATEVGDSRLIRVVLELGQVPLGERALRRFLIAPYVAEEGEFELPRPNQMDTHLIFFHAACRKADISPAIRLRYHILTALETLAVKKVQVGAPKDISAACSKALLKESPGHMGHRLLLKEMSRSRFCFVVAGDTASSRRLSEVIASGCIPVFIGLPWPALPLSPFIDFKAFSIFVRLGNQSAWLKEDGLKPSESGWDFEPDPWSAAFIFSNDQYVLDIASVSLLVDYLRSIPDLEVTRLRQVAAIYAPYFTFIPHGGALQPIEQLWALNSTAARRGLAGNLLMSALCAYTAG